LQNLNFNLRNDLIKTRTSRFVYLDEEIWQRDHEDSAHWLGEQRIRLLHSARPRPCYPWSLRLLRIQDQ